MPKSRARGDNSELINLVGTCIIFRYFGCHILFFCLASTLKTEGVLHWTAERETAGSSDQTSGITWTLFLTPEDLDFARDLMLVSHTRQHTLEKINRFSMFAQQVGLKMSQKKPEVMMLNVPNPSPVKMNRGYLPTTKEFTYLRSTVRHDGGAGNDIRNRLNKDRYAFRRLNIVWKSSQYCNKTKLGLYQSCVFSTPLYGLECWRMTESNLNILSTFHTKNPANILA